MLGWRIGLPIVVCYKFQPVIPSPTRGDHSRKQLGATAPELTVFVFTKSLRP